VVGPKQQLVCNGKKGQGRTLPPADLTNVTSVCAGLDHSCAVSNGRVFCWGDASYGATAAPDNITDAVLVRCGELVSCALTAGREAHCWGQVQVDTKDFKQVLGPVNMTAEASVNVGQLSVGWHHVCVVVTVPGTYGSTGQVLCFGYPQALESFPSDASTTDILAAFWSVIVMNIRGVNINISGFRGALGTRPASVTGALEITGGNGYAMARMRSGGLILWGATSAALGVPAGINVTAVASYDSHICVRTLNGSIECYGLDKDQQHLREVFAVTAPAGAPNVSFADSKAAAAACSSYKAQLATMEQLQRDYAVGAEWCGWGFTADKNPAGKAILAYPMQAAGVAGCSEEGAMLYNTTVVPTNGTVMAVCFGKKPASPVDGVVRFNGNTWGLFGIPSS